MLRCTNVEVWYAPATGAKGPDQCVEQPDEEACDQREDNPVEKREDEEGVATKNRI